MKVDYNPTEAKAAAERLKKRHEDDMKFLETKRAQAAPAQKVGLAFRIERARARHRLKERQHEEQETHKTVADARRKEHEAQRKIDLTARKTVAERKLQAKKQKQIETLEESQEARRARLLTEQELRRAQMRPYTEAAKQVGKGLQSFGASAWKGLQKLQEQSDEYHRKNPTATIWGSSARTTPTHRSLEDDFGLSRAPRRTEQPDIIDFGFPKTPRRKSDKILDIDLGDLMR